MSLVSFVFMLWVGDTKQKKPTPLDRGAPTPCKQGRLVSLNHEQQLEGVYFKSVLYCLPDLHILDMLAIAQ